MAYFGASCDTTELNKKFAEKLELKKTDYPLLSDTSKKVAKAYGILNEAGGYPNRVTFYIGKDGKILHIDKKVKTGSHGKDIAKKLKELKVEMAKKKP